MKMDDVVRQLGDGSGVLTTVIACVAIGRAALHFNDKARIFSAAHDQGWTSIGVRWAPFAYDRPRRRWGRTYRVTYTDEAGQVQIVHCKTGLFSDVHWRDPRRD